MTDLLHASGLTKTFLAPGDRRIPVLRGVDLTIEPGRHLSIRGESGSGKSTLLNLLAALETPTEGTLDWQGERVQAQPQRWQARRRGEFLGFVFQAYYLVPELNALENVLLARRLIGPVRGEHRMRAEELLKELGLGERLDYSPNKLSGGERQRVAVARALLNRPALLLADEPTGNLDEQTAERVMRELTEIAQAEGATLLLVTHSPKFANQ
ncbi:MAG: ABC transporter ATP-binding protein, partial [Opitutales bacterium]